MALLTPDIRARLLKNGELRAQIPETRAKLDFLPKWRAAGRRAAGIIVLITRQNLPPRPVRRTPDSRLGEAGASLRRSLVIRGKAESGGSLF